MLAGATGIDFVLLVIAADDGVMPQTREHLAIVDLLGIERGIVALTKVDLAPPPGGPRLSSRNRASAGRTGLAGADIVPVSTVTGEGIDALRQTTVRRGAIGPGADATRPLPPRGRSLVHACGRRHGRDRHGAVRRGRRRRSGHRQPVRVWRRAFVRSMRRTVRPNAGRRATAARSIWRATALRRMSSRAATWCSIPICTRRPTGSMRRCASSHSKQKPVTQWMPVRLHHARGRHRRARRAARRRADPRPAAKACVQLVLERPIAAAAGDRFVLRDTTAQRTIGGGRFLDLRAPARKRRTPERLAQLDGTRDRRARKRRSRRCSIAAVVCRSLRPSRATARSRPTRSQALVERGDALTLQCGDAVLGAVGAAAGCSSSARSLATLDSFHATNPDLARHRPRAAAPAARAAPSGAGLRCRAAGLARAHGDRARRRLGAAAGPRGAADAAGRKALEQGSSRCSAGRALPPAARARHRRRCSAREKPTCAGCSSCSAAWARSTRSRTIISSCAAPSPRWSRSSSTSPRTPTNGQFTAAQFRDRLDNGRKVAIQILEFFDRHGVTLRRGDLRRINKHRLDLFRPRTARRAPTNASGRESSPVGRPDFKSGRGRESVLGGFDSLSLPPRSKRVQ